MDWKKTIFPVDSVQPVEAMLARQYSRESAVSRAELPLLQENGFQGSVGAQAHAVMTGRVKLIGIPATL